MLGSQGKNRRFQRETSIVVTIVIVIAMTMTMVVLIDPTVKAHASNELAG
jgi:hypothetical protein